MQDQTRRYYPHVQSVLMDEATVAFYQGEMREVPFRLKRTELQLQANAMVGYRLLMENRGTD